MERLAWVEMLDRHGDVASRYPVQAWPLRIGRAYSSDLVLDDAHVAAHHLEIAPAGEGLYQVKLVSSINGMTIDSRRGNPDEASITANDVVRIGQTQLRIRPLDYVVAAEKPMRGTGWMRRWPMMIAGMAAMLLAHLLSLWLDYNRDEGYDILLSPLLGDIPVLLLWVGFWALIGRVLSGQANFIAHAVIASLGTGLILLLNNFFYGYADFAFNTSLVSNVISEVIETLIVGTMLYRHIALVSRIGWRQLSLIVSVLVVSLVGLIHLTDSLNADKNLGHMSYSGTVGPPSMLLAHGVSTEEFIDGASRLKDKVDEK
jgi:Inner membrane component of T3SS, cytoplasmic domain